LARILFNSRTVQLMLHRALAMLLYETYQSSRENLVCLSGTFENSSLKSRSHWQPFDALNVYRS